MRYLVFTLLLSSCFNVSSSDTDPSESKTVTKNQPPDDISCDISLRGQMTVSQKISSGLYLSVAAHHGGGISVNGGPLYRYAVISTLPASQMLKNPLYQFHNSVMGEFANEGIETLELNDGRRVKGLILRECPISYIETGEGLRVALSSHIQKNRSSSGVLHEIKTKMSEIGYEIDKYKISFSRTGGMNSEDSIKIETLVDQSIFKSFPHEKKCLNESNCSELKRQECLKQGFIWSDTLATHGKYQCYSYLHITKNDSAFLRKGIYAFSKTELEDIIQKNKKIDDYKNNWVKFWNANYKKWQKQKGINTEVANWNIEQRDKRSVCNSILITKKFPKDSWQYQSSGLKNNLKKFSEKYNLKDVKLIIDKVCKPFVKKKVCSYSVIHNMGILPDYFIYGYPDLNVLFKKYEDSDEVSKSLCNNRDFKIYTENKPGEYKTSTK